MIRNIAFDFGGVIIRLSQSEAIRRFGSLGLADAHRQLDAYTQTGIFGAIERGEISAEEFRLRLGTLCGRTLSADECRWAWLGYNGGIAPGALDTLQELRRQGFRVIILSNTNPYMMSWAMSDAFSPDHRPLSDYADAVYLSYQCHAMKPDERFFRAMLSGEGILPGETLFLDDGPRNIQAAEQLGIHGWLIADDTPWTQDIWKRIP